MKKFILLIILFTCLLPVISSNTYAQSSGCWKEYSDAIAICAQATTKHNSCTDPDLNSPCYQESNRLLDKCDQTESTFHQCLGVDKNPWKLQSSNPGHLTCEEWKKLIIVGTAQNCVAPVTELFERKLWCLSSAAEISQVRSHPVDYILDFDPNSCITTEDDVKGFKAGLPLTPGSPPEVSQKVTKNNTGQKTPSPFGIFGINPYETWLNLQSLLYLKSSQLIEDTEMLALNVTGHKAAFERMQEDRVIREGVKENSNADKDPKNIKRSEISGQELKDLGIKASVDELLNRTPELTEEIIKKAQEDWERMVNPNKNETVSPYKLDILKGEIQIKLPGKSEWSDLKQGDPIPSGSTIFTGMDTTTVLSIKNKGVVQVLPFTEITITEKGLEQASQDKKTTTDIDLRTGEIELNVEGGAYSPSFQVFTTNAVAGVKGTHFWVSYDKDKRLSMVGVYRGEVEVKTKDGKIVKVKPEGDKPGVVVVAQKLSPVKLVLAGLVVAAVIGGAILIVRRKFVPKGFGKKRK